MALYKEYGLNPLAGCGSALIQMPIFMVVLAAMQLYKFEFTKGTFMWIQPGATKFLGMNLASNLGQPDQLLVIIYGVSMIVSQLLMPVTDPANIRQQRLMGLGVSIMITFGMFTYVLPSAFTLYWVFANVLATAQALWAYKMPAPPLEKVQTVKGGVKPKPGFMEKLQMMMEAQAEQQKGLEQKPNENPPNGKPKNGKPEARVDPKYFGKTGNPKKGRKK
jgi:YidC/Oxa1 family membrane protein insertase